jgi:hypothetical protein
MDQVDTVLASSNIGFAIATFKAFMEPPGVGDKQVYEALRRLEEALEIVSEYERSQQVTISPINVDELLRNVPK